MGHYNSEMNEPRDNDLRAAVEKATIEAAARRPMGGIMKPNSNEVPLAQIVDELEATLDQVRESLGRQSTRLSPILRQVDEQDSRPTMAEHYSVSPLGDRLMRVTDSLKAVDRGVQDTLERIDL